MGVVAVEKTGVDDQAQVWLQQVGSFPQNLVWYAVGPWGLLRSEAVHGDADVVAIGR